MKKLVLTLILLFSFSISYADNLFVDYGGGNRVEIFEESWICTGNAKLALWVTDKGKIPGCWIFIENNAIQAVFLDGDVAKFPIRALRKATEN